MTPLSLHATAALHSLTAAYTALRHAATAEAAHIAAEALDAPDGLRSPTWGRRHGLGGHGDPTATAYLTGGVPGGINRSEALLYDIGEQLGRLAAPLPGHGAPLDRIRTAIPHLKPGLLGPLTAALGRLDQVARRFLRLRPARDRLVGVPCRNPGCRRADLDVTTVGPVEERVVVCAACGSVWLRADVLGAVGGAR